MEISSIAALTGLIVARFLAAMTSNIILESIVAGGANTKDKMRAVSKANTNTVSMSTVAEWPPIQGDAGGRYRVDLDDAIELVDSARPAAA